VTGWVIRTGVKRFEPNAGCKPRKLKTEGKSPPQMTGGLRRIFQVGVLHQMTRGVTKSTKDKAKGAMETQGGQRGDITHIQKPIFGTLIEGRGGGSETRAGHCRQMKQAKAHRLAMVGAPGALEFW